MNKTRLVVGIVAGFLLAFLCASLFEDLGDVITYPLVVQIDNFILTLVEGEREPLVTRVMFVITALASLPVLGVVSVLVLAVLLRRRRRVWAVAYSITTVGALLLIALLKVMYGRPRPGEGALVVERSLSFPSGHAIVAVSVYGFLTYLIAHSLREPWQKVIVWAVYVVLFVAIAASRVYLGVHYLTDVVAGILAGVAWLVTGIFTLLFLEYRSGRVAR